MNPLALDDLRVLDVSQVMAGPFCALLLGDMGADVIKVEKPNGGDDSRRMAPPFLNGESAAFLAMNRNKRSIALDLKQPAGRDVFCKLAAWADVIIENFRPGTMESLGLGYKELSSNHPELIYCSISGFGQTGPYRARGGFDLVAQGMSGIMSVTGHPGQPPVKVGVPISDLNAGMFAAVGVLSAYIHRLKTGKGQYLETSLLEAGIAYTVWESAIYFATGQIPPPMGSAHRLSAPYQAFQTADGYINIGAANQSNWEKLCRVLKRDDLLNDPRFLDNPSRTTRAVELADELQPSFLQHTTAEWLTQFEKEGVPAGPVYNLQEVYADPQVQAREMRVELEHPRAGRVSHIGIPIKLSDTPGKIRRPAPMLGQHSDEILRELQFDDPTIAALHEQRVVLTPEI
ncbi:MAG TPA: CoA transferase [Anaerolineae bacterium]|nr:CoA transferase [Anaerolineae bacterium]